MKRLLSLLAVVSVFLSFPIRPTYASNLANARWTNTHDFTISHCYDHGNASCSVSILGYSDARVTNVSISFDMITTDGLINIASWNDLSGGQYFTFSDTVPNIEVECVYRLSFTADVVRNGVVETISDHLDLFYTEDM